LEHSILAYDKAEVLLRYMPDEGVVRVRLSGEKAHRSLCYAMQVSPVAKQQAITAGLAWSLEECDRLIELCRVGRRKHDFLKYHLRRGDPVRFKCDKYIAASWYGPVAEDMIV
jgi:hypothetical protein